MRNIKKAHKNINCEYRAIHKCRTTEKNPQLKIVYIDTECGITGGWYFVDESVRIEGQNGSCYGTAVQFCPFCGERL